MIISYHHIIKLDSYNMEMGPSWGSPLYTNDLKNRCAMEIDIFFQKKLGLFFHLYLCVIKKKYNLHINGITIKLIQI